jgi:hypothetical protein
MIYNFIDGVDVYSFPDICLHITVKVDSMHRFAKPVVLLEPDSIIVQGSEVGLVHLARLADGKTLSTLKHTRCKWILWIRLPVTLANFCNVISTLKNCCASAGGATISLSVWKVMNKTTNTRLFRVSRAALIIF